MAWPTGTLLETLVGTYYNDDGSPMSGKAVTFRTDVVVTDLNSHGQFGGEEAKTVTAVTDSSGRFQVSLRATDDQSTYPQGWVWLVKEPNRGSERRISLPYTGGVTYIDTLGDAVQIKPAASALTTALFNRPLGVARLDASGKIPSRLLYDGAVGTGSSSTGGGVTPDLGGYVTIDSLSQSLKQLRTQAVTDGDQRWASKADIADIVARLVLLERTASTEYTIFNLPSLGAWFAMSQVVRDASDAVQTIGNVTSTPTQVVRNGSFTALSVQYLPNGFSSGHPAVSYNNGGQVVGASLSTSRVISGLGLFTVGVPFRVPSTLGSWSDMDVIAEDRVFRLTVTAEKHLRVHLSNTGAVGNASNRYGDWAAVIEGGTIRPGRTYVVTVVSDGANVTLRLNGAGLAQTAFTGTTASVLSGFTIGARNRDGANAFTGLVGDVAVSTQAVTGNALNDFERELADSAYLGWPVPDDPIVTDPTTTNPTTPTTPASGHGDPNVVVSSATFQDDFADKF